jgi:hypothetical protein
MIDQGGIDSQRGTASYIFPVSTFNTFLRYRSVTAILACPRCAGIVGGV